MRTSPYSSTGLNHWFQGRTWLWAVARAPQWFTLPSSAELLWWSWGPNDSLGIKRAWFTSNSDQRSSAWFWPSQNTEMQFWNTAVNTMRLLSSVPRTGLCFATLRMSLWHSSEPFLNLLGAPFRCHPQGLSSACPGTVSCHASPAVPGVTGCASNHLLKSCDVLSTCSVSLGLGSPPVYWR